MTDPVELDCGRYLRLGPLAFVITRVQKSLTLSRLGGAEWVTITGENVEDRIRRARAENQRPFEPRVGMTVTVAGRPLVISKLTLDEGEVTDTADATGEWPERRYKHTLYLDCRDALSLQAERDYQEQAAIMVRRSAEAANEEPRE